MPYTVKERMTKMKNKIDPSDLFHLFMDAETERFNEVVRFMSEEDVIAACRIARMTIEDYKRFVEVICELKGLY
jgi:hypothetical protein